jgi:two-component system cell cycle sensor histidine kinase/response regulator CckA
MIGEATLNKGGSILIIDDEKGPREALRQILKDKYDVKTVPGVPEAIDLLSKTAVTVVMMDIRMPRVDGITGLRQIKAKHPDVEVIMVTAYASIDTARKAIEYGALEYLVKPFDIKDVYRVVEKAIARHRQSTERTSERIHLKALVAQRTKELLLTERFRQGLFENANDGILILDQQGSVLDCNRKACEIYQCSKDELTGTNITLLQTAEDETFRENTMKMIQGKPQIFEVRYQRTDGSAISIEFSSKAIDLDGNLVIQAFLRDITEKKKIEGQLLHSQKMESIGTLAGGLAHDFNNILTVIMGHSHLLKDSDCAKSNEEITTRLTAILKAAETGATTIRKLLDFAKDKETEHKPFNINDAVTEMVSMLNTVAFSLVNVRKVLDPTIPAVKGDQGQLKQAIMNIFLNARDAMPKGGILTIQTSAIDIAGQDAAFPLYIERRRYVAVKISDTGTGIHAESLQRIFEPFYTTKERGKGSGLGLSMVYSIVKNHKGYIMVDSTVGRGTIFNILLPLE